MIAAKPKCIVWNSALSTMFSPDKPAGGFVVQLYFWAQAFWNGGYEIFSFKQDLAEPSEPMNFPIHYEQERISQLSFLYHSYRTLRRVKPEVIILRGGKNRNLLFLAFWCRLLRIKLVQFQGSDLDLLPLDSQFSSRMNEWMYKLGLKMTQYVVVQNDFQESDYHQHISKQAVLKIPNVWSSQIPASGTNPNMKDYVLWVGNFRTVKKPMMVVEVARLLPQITFLIIGAPNDKKLYEQVQAEVEKDAPNVKLLGGKPFREMNVYYENAKVLICTSEREGFPNTFLQAWSLNKPVVSTVDPSGLIEQHQLGFHCTDVDVFAESINRLYSDKDLYCKFSENVSQYFKSAHDVNYHYKQLLDFINN